MSFACMCVCVWVCTSLTLDGVLEKSSIKKMNESRPAKDTNCLVPCLAVSNTNQHTTPATINTHTTLDRGKENMGDEGRNTGGTATTKG